MNQSLREKGKSLKLEQIALDLGNFHLKTDLEFPAGKLSALLGPSGCGKTTLLKVIAGLETPREGRIFLGGREIGKLDSRYRNIAMVFQDYALFPHMSVEKNILYGMKAKKNRRRSLCREFLELVELKDFGQRRIPELSGGEKQRVALARALATEPDLLLLDEPLSALDARLRRSLRRQIRRIQEETGITTIHVTHDQEEAMAISDQVVLMNKGQVLQSGTPEEIYDRPANLFSASFFGQANLIPLKEAAKLPIQPREKKDLQLPVTAFHRKSSLFFRPEHLRILPPGSTGEAQDYGGPGKLSYREFAGDFHFAEITWPTGMVKAKIRELPPSLKKKDSPLVWTVSARNCLILPSSSYQLLR